MLVVLLCISIAVAQDADIDAGKQLVDGKIPCDQLTENQLVQIGDYIMETMHPGDAHKQLEQQLGGEDSEQLKQAHLQMAQRMYCGRGMGTQSGGMMGSRSYGMMGWDKDTGHGRYEGEGRERIGFVLCSILAYAAAAFLFSVIFWGTHHWMIKKR